MLVRTGYKSNFRFRFELAVFVERDFVQDILVAGIEQNAGIHRQNEMPIADIHWTVINGGVDRLRLNVSGISKGCIRDPPKFASLRIGIDQPAIRHDTFKAVNPYRKRGMFHPPGIQKPPAR